jgi:arginine deiminase
LTNLLFAETAIEDVIAVVLPPRSTAIHLDMVWTQIDTGLCAAYPPMFRGPRRAAILHCHRGEASVHEPDTLWSALAKVGLEIEPVWTGGSVREQIEREQWASGCNFLSVAPGQVLAYARNEGTLRALEAAGFQLIDGERLLSGEVRLADDARACITFTGSELVRGGGGPRCMSFPIARD